MELRPWGGGQLAALASPQGGEGGRSGWLVNQKCPRTSQLTRAEPGATVPKLFTPKFPGLSMPGAELYLRVGKQPWMLLWGENPHICSAPPESAGVLGVTSGAPLAPLAVPSPVLPLAAGVARAGGELGPPDVTKPGLLGHLGSLPAW